MTSSLKVATETASWGRSDSLITSANDELTAPTTSTYSRDAWPTGIERQATRPETASGESGTRVTTLPVELIASHRVPATLLAEWNGFVVNVDRYYFSAVLKGIFGDGVLGEDEDAEIPVSDVSDSDKELLLPGNFFRLCVFYEIREDGQPRRYTQVVFRRLPGYRAEDLDLAASRASELHRGLRVE